jgi:hypothetical protein
MAKNMDYRALVAQFEANGGQVTKVRTGQGLGLSQKDWRDLTSDRGCSPANRVTSEQAAEMRMERAREENGYYKS